MNTSKSWHELFEGTRLLLNRGVVTLAIVAVSVLALLVTTYRAARADGSSSTKIEAQLSGAMLNGLIPKGKAEFENENGAQKFEVEVENVNLPDGTVLNILVDGTRVGTLTLSGHRGELEIKTNDGGTLPQINSRTRIVITDSAGNTILAGAFSNIPPSPSPTGSPAATPSPTATPTPNEIQATLTGAAIGGVTPEGKAKLETKANGDREFEVEVEDVNLPDGTVLNVLVDGTKVGTLTLTLHRGEFDLESEHGQTVPTINAGTQVRVTDAAGNTILSGTFTAGAPTPTPTPTPTGSPTPTPTPNPNATVRLESRLAGGAINGLTPKGHAKFRVRNDGRSKLDVHIEKVNVAPGTVLNVLVDNIKIGEIVIGQDLEGKLQLDTQKGDTIPNVTTASTIVISNSQNATILSGVFNTVRKDVEGNDIDDDEMFVEQQYNDFLDREGDDNGLDFWEGGIKSCGSDAACRDRSRINTSGAFFLSIEFRDTGYLLYRFNKAAFGTMPRRNDFLVEMQSVAQGVIVNAPGWQQKLEDNKRQEAERFAQRQDFRQRFDDKSNRDFVNLLFSNAGVTPDTTERENLIHGLDAGTETRGSVLRKVAENADFSRKEQNPAFVLMQYFGYLHRNPDEGADHDLSGFNFWLGKLNEHNGNFIEAEMVKAFLNSTEYRQRFDW
jgi:hypothetical protein